MKNKKHILIIPLWYPPEGGYFVKEQAQLLKDKGNKVGLVYVEQKSFKNIQLNDFFKRYWKWEFEDNKQWPELRCYGWTIPKLTHLHYRIWIFQMMKGVQKYIEQYGKPDIIHCHVTKAAGEVGRLAKEKWGIPYVITEHCGVLGRKSKYCRDLFDQWSKTYAKIIKSALINTDYCLPVGDILTKGLQSFVHEKKIPIKVIPNMVDTVFFNPIQNLEKHKEFTFLFIANLVPEKGCVILIKAFKMCLQKHPNIKLRIGGSGIESKPLKELTKLLDIQSHVKFLGQLSRDAVRNEMQQAHFFVVPSLIESFGIVFIESMAMGTPVLTTTVVSESIVTKETGILIDAENIEALENGMLNAIKSKNQFKSEVLNAHVKNNFSKDVVYQHLIDVYNKVLPK